MKNQVIRIDSVPMWANEHGRNWGRSPHKTKIWGAYTPMPMFWGHLQRCQQLPSLKNYNEVKKLLRLYLTLPRGASATSDRSFSALLRLKITLKAPSSIKQLSPLALSYAYYGHIENCRHCKEVCLRKRTSQKTFWKIRVKVCAWLNNDCPPPPFFKTHRCFCLPQRDPREVSHSNTSDISEITWQIFIIF